MYQVMLAYGQLILPERGVVRVTRPILEFHTPWNIFGTANVVKFRVLAGYIKR